MPNTAVDMNSWAVSACYPQSTFYPEGYPIEGFLPEERLSVYEALCMYTKNVHYATGQENVLGTLEIGKFADLTVLEKNLFKIDEKEIKDVKVEQTYVAGNCVFMIK